jgi:hypothetical protein
VLVEVFGMVEEMLLLALLVFELDPLSCDSLGMLLHKDARE